MNKRLLCIGLLAITQLFATGCLFHPVARWRSNHPCGACAPCGVCKTHHYHPLLHPVETRRTLMEGGAGAAVGPVVTNPPCHGCNGSVGLGGGPVGVTGTTPIG